MNYKILWAVAGLLLMVRPRLNRKHLLPSIKGIIETAHHLPGRLRLVVPSLIGQPDLTEKLENQMKKFEYIKAIEARPASGSVVICYDLTGIDPVILFGITARLLDLEKRFEKTTPPLLWRELKTAGRSVDNAIYSKTAGYMDTKTIVTLIILGTVSYRMIKQSPGSFAPGTVTLTWWLFNLIFMRQGAP